MSHQQPQFDVSPEIQRLGIRCLCLLLKDIQNKAADPAFEELKEQRLSELRARITREQIQQHPLLTGFWQLHQAVGIQSKKEVPSPVNLLTFLLEKGTLPQINLLLDIYNLVSVSTCLALGAHDLKAVKGNIHLRLTTGAEHFWPLGAPQAKSVRAGAYGYVDDQHDLLCWLEVRQAEKTKITLATTHCCCILQGHPAADPTTLTAAAQELIAFTTQFCASQATIIFPAE